MSKRAGRYLSLFCDLIRRAVAQDSEVFMSWTNEDICSSGPEVRHDGRD